jgi:hypothetical protein
MNIRPTARALSLAALVAAAVPLALARCSYSYECDRTTAALMLPAPGDTLVLRARACIDAGPESTPQIAMHVEGRDGDDAPVRLSVIDPVTGDDLITSERPSTDYFPAAQAHCDEGLTITIENTGDTHVTATLILVGDAENSERCDVTLEAP